MAVFAGICAAVMLGRVAGVVVLSYLCWWARVTDVAKCRRQELGLPRGLSSLSD